MKAILPIILLTILFASCGEKPKEEKSETQNSTEKPSFNAENSDPKAVLLANKVIEAHGGVQEYNQTRFIAWNFLGVRDLVWDKYTGLVRIDVVDKETTYIININEDTGSVKLNNKIIKDHDSLNNYIDKGKQIWVNDSYWLVFPFKLKDSGVRLSYIGQDTTLAGDKAEVISLQFDSVGYTPQNKYKAYINPETYLIMQWDYYRNANDSTASIRNLWSDYKDFDGIKFSAGRGERRLSNIRVSNEIDSAVFEMYGN